MAHAATLLAILCASSAFAAQPVPREAESASSRSPVGVAAQIHQVVIPGSELEAKPLLDRRSPIVVRVLATFRHGSDFRYDLEYYGLEPGRYDLRDYLQRKDRSAIDSAQPLWVAIETRLPPGQILPSTLSPTTLPPVGGYRAFMSVCIGLWLAIMLYLIFGGRRKRLLASEIERPLSPVERLRPLIVEAIAGRLTPAGQAELERLLLGYWRRRLGLDDVDPVVALATLRQHPEAGELLRLVEDWLHRPGGAGEFDIATVLAPYQDLPDDIECVSPDSPSNGASLAGSTAAAATLVGDSSSGSRVRSTLVTQSATLGS